MKKKYWQNDDNDNNDRSSDDNDGNGGDYDKDGNNSDNRNVKNDDKSETGGRRQLSEGIYEGKRNSLKLSFIFENFRCEEKIVSRHNFTVVP